MSEAVILRCNFTVTVSQSWQNDAFERHDAVGKREVCLHDKDSLALHLHAVATEKNTVTSDSGNEIYSGNAI
jgi:hypothetical protein